MSRSIRIPSAAMSLHGLPAPRALILCAMGLASAACLPFYPGSPAAYAAFSAASIALAASALWGRHSFFAFFLAVFLDLGFWAKLLSHLLTDRGLIEPVGRFDASPAAWDRALLTAAAGLTATAAAAALCKLLDRGRTMRPDTDLGRSPAFTALGWPLFMLSAAVALALFVLNWHYAILKIGTLPRILLFSSHVHVVIGFIVSWGAALWLVALGFWLVAAGRATPVLIIYIAAVEGALAAVSMGSRAQMILHTGAALAFFLFWSRTLGWRLGRRSCIRAAGTIAALFVLSLAAVSLDRSLSFAYAVPTIESAPSQAGTPPTPEVPAEAGGATGLAAPSPSPSQTPAAAPSPPASEPYIPPAAQLPFKFRLQLALSEISKLFIGRWVGLEGVLAVTSAEGLGPDLLMEGLREDPAKGVESLYQKMANSTYAKYDDFLFMTIPGPLAVLMYGGSVLIMACGMAGFFVLCYAVERFADILLRNPAASAVVGVSLAYLLVQLNFLYLQFIFAIELIAALVFMGAFRLVAKTLPMKMRGAAPARP